MGDRGNVFVVEQYGQVEGEPLRGVYLYTHWTGTELPTTVAAALSKHQRWDDGPYLARIIFCEMVRGNERDTTGFGIALSPPDNEHPIITVDPRTKTVERGGTTWPMEDFIVVAASLVNGEEEAVSA